MSAYAELAVSTNFSFLHGASHAEEFVERAHALSLAGLGVTDRNTVAGVVRAHSAAKEKGLKLAVGARLVFADGTPDILTYPQDRAAWARLTQLLTVGKSRAEKGDCILFLDDLLEHIEGLNLIVMPERRTRCHPESLAEDSAARSPLPPRSEAKRWGGVGGGGNRNQESEISDQKPKACKSDYRLLIPDSWSPHPGAFGADPPHHALRARGEGNPRHRLHFESASQDEGIRHLLHRLKPAATRRSVWLAAAMLYRGDDNRRLSRLAAIAGEAGVPLLAVNDVLYHAPERRALADVVTCIREHVTLEAAGRKLEANAERHLKSPAEMARLFHAAPEAVEQTLTFLERCRFSLDELRYEYPDETRAGYATPQQALTAFAEEGARRRYPDGMRPDIRRALEHELAVTAELNYAPYFLTVHDIVRTARAKGILCQGRGSAANSVICYCLGITEVDPERIDLLFERFVSAERREPPDIDVDFEHERREEVIQYIYARYGRERAGLAATVICYRGRSAIRDVGKAFGLSEDVIGALAGTLWGWSSAGVAAAEVRRIGLDPSDPRLARAIALSQELAGFPRHLSQHVGGFVITRSRLDQVVPIENAAMDERTVVEWDKDDLNDLGILKIDVLGLGMLSCLRRAFDLLKENYGHDRPTRHALSCPAKAGHPVASERMEAPCPSSLSMITGSSAFADDDGRERGGKGINHPPPLSLSAVPHEDPAVYRMIQRADTIGVFQIESRAQMSMLPRLKPAKFYDLVIEVAIVRPGPIQGDMVHPYLRRRQGLETVHYPSKELESILHKTLGVPLFQEHAMRIAIVAAGFAPAEADRLRRAMATFKRVGTINSFRDKFIRGMLARNYTRGFAQRCFSQIEGFGEYGFPESHAASFAILVYASAWLKCRYPDVFAAALINSQPMGFYAPAQIVRDAQDHGVDVRPVDVNCSDWDCTLEPLSCDCRPANSASPLPWGEVGERSEPGEGLQLIESPEPPHPNPLPNGEREPVEFRASTEIKGQACLHPRHAEMKNDIRSTHALRLGLRQIGGFSESWASTIESVRGRGFDSVRDLWLRTRLPPAALQKLAQADAFRSLGLIRRDALWALKALRRSGDKDDLPLFAHAAMSELEPDASLPPMPPGEEVIEDYRHLRLSLKAHPVSFLRSELDARGILRHEQLAQTPSGRRVTVAGLVLVRQRPGTAAGVIFMTLEDETGIANTIVWPKIFERFRPVVLGARLVSVTGALQSESGVMHVIVERVDDLTPLLRRLSEENIGNEGLARADEVRRPTHPRAGDALVTSLRKKPQHPDSLAAADTAQLLPKGRNFH